MIMRQAPCPILVVTATIPGNYELVIRAMGRSALDAVETPSLGPGGAILKVAPLIARLDQTRGCPRGMSSGPICPLHAASLWNERSTTARAPWRLDWRTGSWWPFSLTCSPDSLARS